MSKIANPVLRKMYESQCEIFLNCLHFQCACCGITRPKPSGKAGGIVEIYQPDDILASSANPAVYTVCDECRGLPEPERRQKITEYLSSQGLFGKQG